MARSRLDSIRVSALQEVALPGYRSRGGIIIFLLLGELLARVLWKDETVLYPRYHTQVRYGPYQLRRIRPGSEFFHTSIDGRWRFRTNNRGFRATEDYAYEKPAGVFRVLVVGDSHTQGYEVDQHETFCAVLERSLELRGLDAQVMNAGVAGFSNAEELLLLEEEGLRYDLDLAVVAFYGNDFDDNFKSGFFTLDESGQLVATGKMAHLPGVRIQNFIYSLPGVQFLGENSYLYSRLFNSVWTFCKGRLTRQALAVAVAEHGDVEDSSVALATALLRRMRESCAASGVPLAIVDIPRPDLESNDRHVPSMPREMRDEVRRFADHFIDLAAAAHPQRETGRLHVAHGQRHLSASGHALLAGELASVVDRIRAAAISPPVRGDDR